MSKKSYFLSSPREVIFGKKILNKNDDFNTFIISHKSIVKKENYPYINIYINIKKCDLLNSLEEYNNNNKILKYCINTFKIIKTDFCINYLNLNLKLDLKKKNLYKNMINLNNKFNELKNKEILIINKEYFNIIKVKLNIIRHENDKGIKINKYINKYQYRINNECDFNNRWVNGGLSNLINVN
jgi:hypothetical protein